MVVDDIIRACPKEAMYVAHGVLGIGAAFLESMLRLRWPPVLVRKLRVLVFCGEKIALGVCVWGCVCVCVWWWCGGGGCDHQKRLCCS